MSCTRKQIVNQAKSWLGLNEKDGSHKKIIDIYNAHKPLARGYKVKYTDAWCATFVSALAIVCNATDIIPTECGCNEMIKLFKNLGTFVENDSVKPNPGDIIFYDWQDNGVGDNKGGSEHTGIVETVVGDTITVIEGNYNNAVARRQIRVNGKYIRGYGVPKYDAEPVEPTKTDDNCAVELKVLKKGAKGRTVKAMQILLINYGFSCGSAGADGDFGTGTHNAVKAFQKAKKLTQDGICGEKTWEKLLGV